MPETRGSGTVGVAGERPRAWGWVFGAREIDDSTCGAPIFTDFEKDWEGQLALLRRWMERKGYVCAGHEVWSVLRPSSDLPAFLRAQGIGVLVVPGAAVRDRMRAVWEDWDRVVAGVEAVGVRVEIATEP
ncbi:hypothetical protein [Streptomyces sp. NPDC003077]|uniref:hypothetical protein n=1 Tax=Streptomyces sp. NPDC003077 TaxID=3154443 RepID=UPI0033B0D9A9